MSEIRLAYHEGRAGKEYAYPAKHNDRSYNYQKSKHIIEEEISGDKFWDYRDGFVEPGQDVFCQHEMDFYRENFSDFLSEQNKRYQSKGKKTRTMKEYYRSKRSCPHEVLSYLGDHLNHVPPNVLAEIWQEQMEWEQTMFPQVKYLNWALHVDEQSWDKETHQYIHGAPHIHARKVYLAYDENGNLQEEMNRCLGQMEVPLPDPSQKKDRRNNPKMTYTRICREHFQQLCRKHDIEIETEPRDKNESGRNMDEYIRRKKLKAENGEREEYKQNLDTVIGKTVQKVKKYEADKTKELEEVEKTIAEQNKTKADNELTLTRQRTESSSLDDEIENKRTEKKELDDSITEKKTALTGLQETIRLFTEQLKEARKKLTDFFKKMGDSDKEQRYREHLARYESPYDSSRTLLDDFDKEEQERKEQAEQELGSVESFTERLERLRSDPGNSRIEHEVNLGNALQQGASRYDKKRNNSHKRNGGRRR